MCCKAFVTTVVCIVKTSIFVQNFINAYKTYLALKYFHVKAKKGKCKATLIRFWVHF